MYRTEFITLEVRDRQQWRTWLGKHHGSSPGVWLVFLKKHTVVESVPYQDSLDEALCFGWIDSLVKRLDDDRYARKFMPRQPVSKWSDINRKRWLQLKFGFIRPNGRKPERDAFGKQSVCWRPVKSSG